LGRDSYGLDGPGIEARCGEIFHTHPDLPWGLPSLLTMSTRSFPGVKRLGRGAEHPLPSTAEVKKRVELYLYSSFGLRGLFWDEIYLYF